MPTSPRYDAIEALQPGETASWPTESPEAARRQAQNTLAAMRRRGVRVKTQVTGRRVKVRMIGRAQA